MTAEELFDFLKMYKSVFEGRKEYKKFTFSKFPNKNMLYELSSHFKTNNLTINHLTKYLAYKYLWTDDFDIKRIKISEISATFNVFSKERLSYDIEYIKQLIETTNANLEDFYKVNSDGYNLLYKLILKGRITPYFYLKFFDKIYFQNSDDIIEKTLYIFNRKINFLKTQGIVI